MGGHRRSHDLDGSVVVSVVALIASARSVDLVIVNRR
jgi:hypothetical protein